jgi:hypothetical protein
VANILPCWTNIVYVKKYYLHDRCWRWQLLLSSF